MQACHVMTIIGTETYIHRLVERNTLFTFVACFISCYLITAVRIIIAYLCSQLRRLFVTALMLLCDCVVSASLFIMILH